jgi:3-deoxy-manno-octulosonate cytidylyltransferase (CMP-KDO synthetase)
MDATTLDTAIIVPARLQSERFPRKLLHKIHGKPLILWTASRLAAVSPGLPIFFAVEDEELEVLLQGEGYCVFRTRGNHLSGTDRIAEVNQHLQAKHVLNVQADEPLITREQLCVLNDLIHGPSDMATLAFRFESESDFRDPNCVKVVLDRDGHALYFSRAPIPCLREFGSVVSDDWVLENACYHHMGIYAYKSSFLDAFGHLPHGTLEQVERLEQLRALENGYKIIVGISRERTVGVDTLEDVGTLETFLA